MDTFVKGGERSLKARAEDEQAVHEAEVRELRAKIGELVLELDARTNWQPCPGTREGLLTVQGAMRAGERWCRSRSCAAGSGCRGRRSTIAGSGRGSRSSIGHWSR